MATKKWRLVVAGLGGGAPLSEVSVDADNWMSALRAGRQQLGEEGVIPTGASCAVAPNGKVTILDPTARRTYVLTPDVAQSFARTAHAPRIPPETVPRPNASPVASASTSAVTSAEAGAVTGGMAAMGPAVAPAAAAEAAAPAAAAKAPSSPPPPQMQSAVASAAASAFASPSSRPPPSMSGALSQEVPKAAKVPKSTVAYMQAPGTAAAGGSKEIAVGGGSQQQAAMPQGGVSTAAMAVAANAPLTTAAVQQQPASDGLEVLAARDAEPTAESPLLYRERTFVVERSTSPYIAERLLRARFDALRKDLEPRPPGKFVNFAVFDHRWTERPERPPLVAIQWKDWRGEPIISHPFEESASTSSRPPSRSSPPVASPASTPPPSASTPPAAGEAPRQRSTTSEQDDRLAHAFEALQDLFFLTNAADGLGFALRLLHETIPSEAGSACLYDINTDEFRFVALDGPGAEERRGEAIPSHVGLFGAAASRVGQPLLIEDVTRDERFDPGVDGRVGLDHRTMIYVPLAHDGRLLGMLQLINRQGSAQFGKGDANIAVYVGQKLSAFLHSTRMADSKQVPIPGTRPAKD